MSQSDLVAQFQAISGKSESLSRNFLQTASWNLELALSNYFGSADYAPPDEVAQTPTPTLIDTTPPPQSTSVLQPIPSSVVPVFDDDDVSTIGLFVKSSKTPIPLKALTVKAEVVDLVAEVEVGQRFVNNTDNPLEALFVFQQEDSTIFDLAVEIDGKVIRGQCKEKEEAFSHYDDSIASGHNAVLLEAGDKKDEFKLNVGNLAPGQEATVFLKYVTELHSEGEALKFSLPITRTPIISGGDKVATTTTTTTSKSGEGEGVGRVEDGLHVNVNIKMAVPILGVEGESSHRIDSTIEGNTASVRYTTAGTSVTSFETLRFLIGFADSFKPRLIFETEEGGEGESALMVTFSPKIKEAVKAASPLDFDEDTYQPFSEVIFLVDRSGSMAGSRMNQAKNALHLFLRSLPEGTQFNIYGFGSSFVKLFPSSVEYNGRTFQAATQHVNEISANLAGTDILPPLRDILSQGANPDYPRQLFCLTDGDVTNTNEVLEYIRKSGNGTRIFTFGIGADASPTLVRGMAKAGKGEAEFVASGTRLESKVLKQLQRALQPMLKNVKVEWGEKLQSKVKQSPPTLPPLFEGERLTFYALLDKGIQLDDLKFADVVIKAQTADADSKEIVFPLKFDEGDFLLEKDVRKAVHRLAVSELIKHLSSDKELGKQNKDEIIRLGVKYSIASEYTSFVAVNERKEAVEGTLMQVNTNEATLNTLTGGKGGEDVSMLLDQVADGEGLALPEMERNKSGGGGLVSQLLGGLRLGAMHLRDPSPPIDLFATASGEAKKTNTFEEAEQFFSLGESEQKESSSNRAAPKALPRAAPAPSPVPSAPGASLRASSSSSSSSSSSVSKPSSTAGPSPPPPAIDMSDFFGLSSPSGGGAAAPCTPAVALPPSQPTSVVPAQDLFSAPSSRSRVYASDFDDVVDPFEVVAEPAKKMEEKANTSSLFWARDSAKGDSKKKEKRKQQGKKRKSSVKKDSRQSFEKKEAEEEKKALPKIESVSSDDEQSEGDDDDYGEYEASSSSSREDVHRAYMMPLEPAKPKLVVNAHMRPLDRLVQLQQFNGSWVLSEDLADLFKSKNTEAIKAAIPEILKGVTPSSEGEALWVTALALSLLENAFSADKEEWKMLAGKATKWLKIQTKKASVPYDTLLQLATSAIQSWTA